MAYPDLYNDESVLLNAQNVKVKSVTFEAVLTTKRLILVDSKKHLIAPQEILLATLRDVEEGENAIRDPTITLSLITNSGATRQMILTFSKTSGGDRKRECDEWIRILRQNLSPTFQHQMRPNPEVPTPPPEPVHVFAPQPTYVPETAAPARVEITNAPQPKKKIEIARPIMKIVENPPTMPKPIETTSLPVGSFCNRCGNRVPPESVFCNRCGTPVVRDPDQVIQPDTPVQAPTPQAPPQVSPPPASIPQLHVPIPPPVFGSAAGERKERPIEQVIHSIEPLIEDSVPRTEPAPLIIKPQPVQLVTHTPVEPVPEPVVTAEGSPETASGVQWPVVASDGSPSGPAPAAAVAPAEIPPPPLPAPRSSGKKYIAIVIAIIVILAVVGSAILFINPQQTPTPAVTPTTAVPTLTPVVTATTVTPQETMLPVMTASPTPSATTVSSSQIVIPSTGVWVRVNYPGSYASSIGTPGAETARTDTGEHLYRVSTSTGIVVASVQKVDATGNELRVEVYKDGNLVTEKTTTGPKGIVEIQIDLRPTPAPTTPTPMPVVTTTTISGSGNVTANQTQKNT
ncbi:zinc-ribbon domain-containing protein [uncultured Methanoregula sp.]|uniref:zinc-ribbon domain-containing protein n=1 Tax=uncultured Methanoregula sp. TaxID=1005933 RepID=UPI002AAAA3A3|nr:zinc-ribbon domain-containing protein [uncultured Methanoregula sp.]